jgi:hypothetical protein
MTRGDVSPDMIERITRPVVGCMGSTLRTLNLTMVFTIRDRDITCIARMASLTALDLTFTAVTDHGANALGACTALEVLSLRGCNRISELFRGPFHLLPRLRDLDLGGRRDALPAALENLASATALQVLHLTDWTDNVSGEVRRGQNGPTHTPLSFEFLKPLVSLTRLDLSGSDLFVHEPMWLWPELLQHTASIPALQVICGAGRLRRVEVDQEWRCNHNC